MSRNSWTGGRPSQRRGYDCLEDCVSTKSDLISTCRSPITSETQTISSDVILKGPIFRKIDYIPVFNLAHPTVGRYYDRISFDGLGISLSQMGDAHIKRLASYCGIDVKKESQGTEARAQSATWMAAGFSRIRALEALAGMAPQNLEPLLGRTVIGYVWAVHIAYWNPDDKPVVRALSVDN